VHDAVKLCGVDAFSDSSLDVEVLRLYCKCLLDLKLISWVVHLDIKVLQDNGDRQKSFLPREAATYASSDTVAKRSPGTSRELLKLFV
jgi:hypothetical protein